MKRSEINRYLEEAKEFFARHNVWLPPFANWTAQQWQTIGHEADEIRTRLLGWDVTDFGSGDFFKVGLTAFTLRNGKLSDPKNPKIYAEKMMLVREGQITPWHFHRDKTEDIINRGTGALVIELRNSLPDERFDDVSEVTVSCDGVVRKVPAGGTVILKPGESITLTPFLYHTFYGQRGAGWTLVGEVSSVNDDATDNRFNPPLPRFPAIEEDEKPKYLLCSEYPAAK